MNATRGPRRILQVLEATEGGTRRHLMDLCLHLDPGRFTVSVACSVLRDPAFAADIDTLRARGIRVHVVPMQRAISPVRDLVALVRLWRLMRVGAYDVVHTHSSKAGFLGRLAAHLAGVPRVVHTPHTFPFEMEVGSGTRRLYAGLERLAARFTQIMVCVCPSQRPAAQALVGARRTVVIENGIAPLLPADAAAGEARRRALGLASDAVVAGVIGRMSRQKGHADFVAAARSVAARLPMARFLLVGDGECRPAVVRRIAAAGLEDRFIFAGAQEDIAGWLAAMDVVVLPSLWEGLPYVLLEAMAAGRAVVATRVGGIPDVVEDGVSGRLVPPRDPEALALALAALLEDAGVRSAIGIQARLRLAGRCRLDDMVKRLESVYSGGLSEG